MFLNGVSNLVLFILFFILLIAFFPSEYTWVDDLLSIYIITALLTMCNLMYYPS